MNDTRLVFLDALRGFDMMWILGAAELLGALGKMETGPRLHGPLQFLSNQMEHVDWAGFHFYDLIFPLFIFIVGVSVVFSLTKTIERHGRTAAVKRILNRAGVLILLCIFYNGGLTKAWPEVRLSGVLQRIGLSYAAAALLFCFFKTRWLAGVFVVPLVGDWALLTFVPIRDIKLDRKPIEDPAVSASAETAGVNPALTPAEKVSGKNSHSKSHWEGAKLVTVIDNVMAQVRSLSTDGKTQTIELYLGRRQGKAFFTYVMEKDESHGTSAGSSEPELKTATVHPMQYYLSLPDGWTPRKEWPVVIAIDGSGKDFLDLARLYVEERKGMPFIIVSPLVLTNGGGDLRRLPNYNYSKAVWDEVDRTGKCKNDLDGLVAVIADVHRRYRGEERVYLSGFSAGADTMWAMVFQHPEILEAAAPTCGNFGGRCITEEEAFSKAQARASLPIKGFEGENDYGREVLGAQFQLAKSLAEKRGYKNISYQVVPGEHEPLAAAVLSYCSALRNARTGTRRPFSMDYEKTLTSGLPDQRPIKILPHQSSTLALCSGTPQTLRGLVLTLTAAAPT